MHASIKSIAIFIITCFLILALFSPLVFAMHPAVAQEEGPAAPREGVHRETGLVNFIGADPRDPIVVPGNDKPGLTAVDHAQAILAAYAPAFGVEDPETELNLLRTNEGQGRISRRYQQMYEGIPVFGGELILNMDDRGRMLSMTGEVSPDLSLSTQPAITADQARQRALQITARDHGIGEEELEASVPSLWILDERLLKPSDRPAALVWRVEVSARRLGPIDELVLVDAQTGNVPVYFNQVDTALNRVIYDNYNDDSLGLPGNGPVRTEGGPIADIPDADLAYDFTGDTYEFYAAHHGRDGINDAGMDLVSTTRYCDPLYPCPYANAYWTGANQQMVFGQGYTAADDVVAHEMTHGVTSYESELFYYYQSGAINEAFSDLWGEFVDLTNGAGSDDPSDRWWIGEDLGGAIRYMADPTVFSDPDRMTSEHYHTESWDNGGVHINMGVNSKAVYLMTDGGSFNGYNVSPLGIDKVAAIYYDVQTNMLTSGSDFLDLHNALYQSCLSLVGGAEGITRADCLEVREATLAVEMDQEPEPGNSPEAALCPTGQVVTTLYNEDFEGTVNWSTGVAAGEDLWFLISGYATSGEYSLYLDDSHPDDPFYGVADTWVRMNANVALPAGSQPYVRFNHAFQLDTPDFDGGWVEIQANDGGWTDLGSLIDSGLEYNGKISAMSDNLNPGHDAFVDLSNGYVSTRADLSSYAGDDVRIRFRFSRDSVYWDLGWFIDDVQIYTCSTLSPSYWVYIPFVDR